MAGVKGQGKGNGNSLRHGGKSLLALVERSQDESHPVMLIVKGRADAYVAELGGAAALSAQQLDVCRHGAVLAILADMTVHRIINERGRPRRMAAMRFRELCFGYSRIVESHARLMALVGLERRERLVEDPVEAARALAREQEQEFAAYRERGAKDGDDGEQEQAEAEGDAG